MSNMSNMSNMCHTDAVSTQSQQTGSLSTKTKQCSHGYRCKSNCKKCSPHLLCKHQLFKRRCVSCTGGCEHGKKSYCCMICNSSLTCVHGVWKYSCSTCNPPKPKNTAGFDRLSLSIEATIIRKTSDKTQFTKYCKEHFTRHDESTILFGSYHTQSEFVKTLWTYDDTE